MEVRAFLLVLGRFRFLWTLDYFSATAFMCKLWGIWE